MSKALPTFKARPLDSVRAFCHEVFSHDPSGEHSHFVELVVYEDHHFRAFFAPGYFTFQPGQAEPSKSQWSSLKKRMKRHDPLCFSFKEHGADTQDGSRVYWVDFGFFPA